MGFAAKCNGGVCAALAIGLVLAPAAAALEPGVHVDPGSPAAKQYALPLNQAREAGTPASRSGAGSEAALFGAGIKTPPSGGSGSSAGSRRHANAASERSGRERTTVAAVAAGKALAASTAASEVSDRGSGSALALVGGGVVVIVLGALGGTVLRHSRRDHAEPKRGV